MPYACADATAADATVNVTVAKFTHPVTVPVLAALIVQLSWFTVFEPTIGVVNSGAEIVAPVSTVVL